MATVLPKSVNKVIEEFEKLPGVGPKSAARMAYHYLRSTNGDSRRLADALIDMDERVMYCSKCFNVSETEVCSICSLPIRDSLKLCIVEEPLDVVAFENASIYNGYYFVLGGVISPADGVGPEELRFNQLKSRVETILENQDMLELVVATNPSLEGEATSAYIQDLLKSFTNSGKLKITRLAMGLPTGADLEYADRLTLRRAMDGRQSV